MCKFFQKIVYLLSHCILCCKRIVESGVLDHSYNCKELNAKHKLAKPAIIWRLRNVFEYWSLKADSNENSHNSKSNSSRSSLFVHPIRHVWSDNEQNWGRDKVRNEEVRTSYNLEFNSYALKASLHWLRVVIYVSNRSLGKGKGIKIQLYWRHLLYHFTVALNVRSTFGWVIKKFKLSDFKRHSMNINDCCARIRIIGKLSKVKPALKCYL